MQLCTCEILIKFKNTLESCYTLPIAILERRSEGSEQILENQGRLLQSSVQTVENIRVNKQE